MTERDMSKLQTKKAYEELLLRVHERYYTVLSTQESLRLAQSESAALQKQLDNAKVKLDCIYFNENMWDNISQIAITILGATAIILVAKKNKWGFVAGFASQPFWFITSLVNKQWGVFVVSIIFTGSWLLGIYEWFYKKEKIKESIKKD